MKFINAQIVGINESRDAGGNMPTAVVQVRVLLSDLSASGLNLGDRVRVETE